MLGITLTAGAQNYELNLREYTWDAPATFKPDTSESKYPMVTVFLKKVIQYEFNQQLKQLEQYSITHYLRYLNDNKAVEDYNKLYVEQRQDEALINLKTRVIDNGRIVSEASQKDFIEVEEDKRKYNMIAVKGLAKGMLIETIVVMRLDGDLYGVEYYQMSTPVKHAEFTLITPRVLEFKCKTYNGFGNGNVSDSVVNDETRFYFASANNIPALDNDEEYALINANKMRIEYVYHQNADTKKQYIKWPEIGRTFFDRINYNYDKNTKDLDKILSKINLKQYSTEEEKIFAIENFLKTNIAIESNIEDGETFGDMMKKKFATPYRMNQITAQLYRRADIPYETVLTCKKSYKRLDPGMDSWSFLNDVIYYFPSCKKFIDPQEPLKRLGYIDTDFLGQNGLFIKAISIGDAVSASASVKPIPANDVKQAGDIERYTLSFDSDMDKMTINYHREMNGYAEQGIKAVYFVTPDDKKKEVLEGFVKGLAQDAKVENLVVENYHLNNLKEVNAPLVIKADLYTGYYAEQAGDGKILLKVGEIIGQQMEMYQDKPRVCPVDISFTHSYNRTIIVNIPQGYKVKGQDKLSINYQYKNAKGEPSYGFISSAKVENNQLIIECTEYYNELSYPLESFDTFKKVINAAADFNKISVLLEK